MSKSKSGSGEHRKTESAKAAKAAKAARDNRSRQLNPEHSAYRLSRDLPDPKGSGNGTPAKTPKP